MNVTVSDVSKLFLSSLEVRQYSPETVKTYGVFLRDLAEFIGRFAIPLEEVSFHHAEGWLTSLSKREYSGGSIQGYLSAARNLWAYLIRAGHVKVNPFREVSKVRYQRPIPRPLSEDEVSKIIQAEHEVMWRAIWEFFYCTGARISEVKNLPLENLSLAESLVRIKGKGSRERYVPLTPQCVQAIQEWLKVRRQGVLLFPGRCEGEQLGEDQVRARLRLLAAQVGITRRVHPHLLRHSIATHLHNRGVDLKDLQEFMGHANIAATQIYTHVSKERLRSVILKAHPSSVPS